MPATFTFHLFFWHLQTKCLTWTPGSVLESACQTASLLAANIQLPPRKCRCKKPHSGSQAMSRHLLVFRMNIVQLGTCLDSTADKDDLFHLFFTQDLVWRTHPSRFKNELVPPPSKTICLKGEVGKSWIYIVTYFRISVLNSKFSSQSCAD